MLSSLNYSLTVPSIKFDFREKDLYQKRFLNKKHIDETNPKTVRKTDNILIIWRKSNLQL